MYVDLNLGYRTVIDDEDWPLVSSYTWLVMEHGKRTYARARDAFGDTIYMHRLILDIWDEREVDHINRDTLDNRRANLRIATVSQNRMNRSKFEGNYSSPYKGVSQRGKKWRAQITLDKKVIHIGTYDSEIEAAVAYNEMATKLHGEFAKLNDLLI
jgi:HNH endonuclease